MKILATAMATCLMLEGCFTTGGAIVGAGRPKYAEAPNLAAVPEGAITRLDRTLTRAASEHIEGRKDDIGDQKPECVTVKTSDHWYCVPPAQARQVAYQRGNYAVEGALLGALGDVAVLLAVSVAYANAWKSPDPGPSEYR